jgi:hypothetical protein
VTGARLPIIRPNSKSLSDEPAVLAFLSNQGYVRLQTVAVRPVTLFERVIRAVEGSDMSGAGAALVSRLRLDACTSMPLEDATGVGLAPPSLDSTPLFLFDP